MLCLKSVKQQTKNKQRPPPKTKQKNKTSNNNNKTKRKQCTCISLTPPLSGHVLVVGEHFPSRQRGDGTEPAGTNPARPQRGRRARLPGQATTWAPEAQHQLTAHAEGQ